MSDLEKLLSKLLIETLTQRDAHHHHDSCKCAECCDCTTDRSFEQTAVRANEAAAFSASESSKMFMQQNAAQFAHLLQMQNDSRTTS